MEKTSNYALDDASMSPVGGKFVAGDASIDVLFVTGASTDAGEVLGRETERFLGWSFDSTSCRSQFSNVAAL